MEPTATSFEAALKSSTTLPLPSANAMVRLTVEVDSFTRARTVPETVTPGNPTSST